jgi:NDP-sugar pyrophosphorylase family protein
MEETRRTLDRAVDADDAPSGILRTHGIVLAGAYPKVHSPFDRLSLRPLLPVAQQPLITYALRWMQGGGLIRATICTNSAARAIRATLDSAMLGMSLDYVEDWTPRGAAGCLRDAGVATDAQTFVVADGTTVPVVDLGGLLESHWESGAAVTVVASHDRRSTGDETARMRPSGIYVMDRRVLARIAEEGFVDIKERLIPSLYRAGERVATYAAREVSPRVFDIETYLALNQWAVERTTRFDQPRPGYRLAGDAVIHESAVVEPGARLLGPVLLGPEVSVAAGATVVGPASLDRGTAVGRDAVVSRSVVWSECHVGEGAFVDRCMLADGAAVGSRQSLYSTLKSRPPGGTRGNGAREAQRSPWAPLTSLLRRPTPTHL